MSYLTIPKQAGLCVIVCLGKISMHCSWGKQHCRDIVLFLLGSLALGVMNPLVCCAQTAASPGVEEAIRKLEALVLRSKGERFDFSVRQKQREDTGLELVETNGKGRFWIDEQRTRVEYEGDLIRWMGPKEPNVLPNRGETGAFNGKASKRIYSRQEKDGTKREVVGYTGNDLSTEYITPQFIGPRYVLALLRSAIDGSEVTATVVGDSLEIGMVVRPEAPKASHVRYQVSLDMSKEYYPTSFECYVKEAADKPELLSRRVTVDSLSLGADGIPQPIKAVVQVYDISGESAHLKKEAHLDISEYHSGLLLQPELFELEFPPGLPVHDTVLGYTFIAGNRQDASVDDQSLEEAARDLWEAASPSESSSDIVASKGVTQDEPKKLESISNSANAIWRRNSTVMICVSFVFLVFVFAVVFMRWLRQRSRRNSLT